MSFKAILGILFGLLAAAVGLLAIITFQYNERVVKSSHWVSHTHEVLDKADEISSLFKDLQMESNAFYIGHDSSLVISYRNTAQKLFSHVDDFYSLVLNSREQTSRIDTLKALLGELRVFTDSVLLIRHGDISSRQVQGQIQRSNLFRTRIENVIGRIKTEEGGFLVERENIYHQNITGFRNTVVGLLTGTVLLIISTFLVVRYNLNKRLKVEDQLQNANDLFAKLFYESPIAIVLSEEATGVILNCNEVFCKTVNIPKVELLGRTASAVGIFVNPEQRAEVVAASYQSQSKHIEVYIHPRGKEKMWISLSAEAITVSGKKCLLSVIMDLSTHKRAEEEIRRSLAAEMELNRLKSSFVTLASHEFRTPLTTILSSAFLLESVDPADRERARKHIARIKSSVSNLTSILDEFLSVTRIEEGQVQANVERLDLRKFLEGACHNLQTFARPGQTIIYDYSGDEETDTDPVLVNNILNNLVSNAIKYSPEQSRIFVSCAVNAHIHLAVKDSGIGIPKEDQSHLFERFYRASNAGTVQGTGLGLHIMKHYVEMLHGSVTVTSDAGKGTEVSVLLPTQNLK
jgi:PAS domain S-box-containing protein